MDKPHRCIEPGYEYVSASARDLKVNQRNHSRR